MLLLYLNFVLTLIYIFCWTFCQIKNHGIPETLISTIMNIAREFFRLPESERMKSYSDDPTKTTRLSTSFNVKTEKVSNWRDFLRLHCHPLKDYVNEWPSNPPSFRWVTQTHIGPHVNSVCLLSLLYFQFINQFKTWLKLKIWFWSFPTCEATGFGLSYAWPSPFDWVLLVSFFCYFLLNLKKKKFNFVPKVYIILI